MGSENCIKLVPKVRLGTFEVEQIVNKQLQDARIQRINQVRQQASTFSKQLLEKSKAKREEYIRKCLAQIQQEEELKRQALVEGLEQRFAACMQEFGSAHARAEQENQNDYVALRTAEIAENRHKAQVLGKKALKELHIQKTNEKEQKERTVKTRKQVLQVEAVRAAHIASLPPVKTRSPSPPPKEQKKAIVFDKSTLFQTERIMKEEVVQERLSVFKDAREAACLFEREQERLKTEKERAQRQNAIKVAERGRQALAKEKAHGNYLRLLEELDKLENKTDKNWDVESMMTSMESSPAGPTNLPSSSRAALPTTSESIALTLSNDVCQEEPELSTLAPRISSTKATYLQEHNTPLNTTQSQVSSPEWLVQDEVPVRDCINFKATTPAHLSTKDTRKLTEIGILLKQLQDEEHRLLAVDQANHVLPENVKSAVTVSHSKVSSESSDGIVVHSDNELRIACKVTEMKTESPSRRKRRELAKALNAIRKERQALDSVLQNCKPMKPNKMVVTGEANLPASATSTPVAEEKAKTCALEAERRTVLKHYVEKLLFMKRQDVKELSVSSSSLSTLSSTPKLRAKYPTSYHVMTTTPEQRSWSKASSVMSSAYDTPNTEKSTSMSNASSLPLGAEAATFSNKSEPLPYPFGMDDQIYQAYQQGLRIMGQDGSVVSKQGSVREQTTESSFMSLTLSASSSTNNDHRSTLLSNSKSQFSFGLSLSGSLCSHEQTKSTRDWDEKFSFTSKTTVSNTSSSGTSISKAESSDSSSTNSESISMPDVDAALRRLGLPSMQSVLRR